MPKRPSPQKKACDACHRRKIQCSLPSTPGPCEWCTHRSLECTFDRERPRKKPRTSVDQSEVHSLSERIKQLEGALVQESPLRETSDRIGVATEVPAIVSPSAGRTQNVDIDTPVHSTTSNLTRTPSDRNEAAIKDLTSKPNGLSNQMGPNWFFNGIPICSEAGRHWMSMKTSQNVSLDDFCIPDSDSSSVDPGSTFGPELCELPDEFLTREILSAYRASSFRLAFPVLDEVLIENTLRSAYNAPTEAQTSTAQLSAMACVLAAISMASHFKSSQQTPNLIDADACAAKARSLLTQALGNTSLTTIQTILLLQLRFMFNGLWQRANMLNSMACSMICSLGGHFHLDLISPRGVSDPQQREINHTRMLFWISYVLDKEISLRTGNPPLLTDTYCDISLPDSYMEYETYPPERQELTDSHGEPSGRINPHLPADPRLSLLKEKVCRRLFSAQALKNDNNQLLLNIRQLDDEIESWRLSIPLPFRPALFVSQSSPLSALGECSPHFNRLISLQLDYHHLMTVIHTTVRKCIPDAGDGDQDLHHVVHSSFDLSLEASRSTIWCIKVLCTNVTPERSRLIVPYLTTAAMSLFLNILIHPLDHTAQLDLETLISVANTVRNTLGGESTHGERSLLQGTSDFVMRLVWLGTCAVTKATRTERV